MRESPALSRSFASRGRRAHGRVARMRRSSESHRRNRRWMHTAVDNQPQRPVQADLRRRRRTRARRAPRRSRDAGRDEGLEALGRQRVHHLVQLLLVRVRHDRRRPRRQAPEDGGRLRPHRESRVAVRQRHFDVRDARLPAAAHDAPLPGAGQRPLGGHLLGRRDRAGRAEDSEDARRDLDRHREGGCA